MVLIHHARGRGLALYRGPFMNLLRDLNKRKDWRDLFGPLNNRMKDQEMILRFFALFHRAYTSPMTEFLNTFAADNRDLKAYPANLLTELFVHTVQAALSALGPRSFRYFSSSLNAAVCDSAMVGLARRLERGAIETPSAIKERYDALLKDPDYQKAVSQGTSHEDNVRGRLLLATEAFAGVP